MSRIHDELADALIEVLEGLGVDRAYKWGPGAIRTPAAVIEPPRIQRTEPDHAEDHIGATDWRFDYPIVFYVELRKDSEVQAIQAALIQLAVDLITAVDNLTPDSDGFVLNGLCTDAKVVLAEPIDVAPAEEGGRNHLAYETHVSVLTFQ